MTSRHKISIIGNPNCGKTTLFNALTGSKQKVGNWAGVTVDKKMGKFRLNQNKVVKIVDLPGVYSLSPSDSTSEDERIARDYIVENPSELILNIVDASNLERNLYLTMQLLEMEIPVLLVVNMLDIAKKRDIFIDMPALEKKLGCPVVGISASYQRGLDKLFNVMDRALDTPTPSTRQVYYPEVIELAAQNLQSQYLISPAMAFQLLEEDIESPSDFAQPYLEAVAQEQTIIENELGDDSDIFIADSRYKFISELVKNSTQRKDQFTSTMTDKVDKIILSRIWGLPIFFFMMYFMFLFSINVGSAFIDFFDILFGTIFVDGMTALLETLHAPNLIIALLANGIGSGIQTVSTFIPVIFSLYLFLSILESSGYMARAAFVMDKFMRKIGLPGKAFVPLIVGFGCNVPAIMATRTVENYKDRIATIMMAPFMSCGARLPIYVLFATAFFPSNGQNIVFALYLIGIIVAVLTGFVIKRTALNGEVSRFIMEVPPYHMPTLSGVLRNSWNRLKIFITGAGKIIVLVVTILATLNTMGTDGTFGNENTPKSLLSQIGKSITPIFEPIGVKPDNWPATVGLFTGIFAKEAIVGTFDSLYTSLADEHNQKLALNTENTESEFSLIQGITEAFISIPNNLAEIGSALADPLGIGVSDLSNTQEAAQDQDVSVTSIDMLKHHFDGSLGAFAYLLMILLYFPCVATVGAIYKEAGKKWTLISVLWTTSVGYSAATLVYQIGRFTQHPSYSIFCIGIVCAVIALFLTYFTKMKPE